MNKKLLTIPIIASVLLLQACSGNSLEKKGSLYINYNADINKEKMNFDMKLNEEYDYDLLSSLENGMAENEKEAEAIQKKMNELMSVATIYQDILFTYTILTEEEIPFILDEDKENYFNSINLETKELWYQNITKAVQDINVEDLEPREIELIDNVKILIDLTNTVLEKSLNKEYDTKTLKEIQLNLEINYSDIVTLFLKSNGYTKEDIEKVYSDIENKKDNDFTESFYYQFMKLKSN